MEMYQPFSPHLPAAPDTKRDKLSAWDVVYRLNMGIACPVTYRSSQTYFVDQASNFLGGMCSVVAVVFRDTRGHGVSAGIARLIATCIPFALCLPYLLLFPFTPVDLAIPLGIGMLAISIPSSALPSGVICKWIGSSPFFLGEQPHERSS